MKYICTLLLFIFTLLSLNAQKDSVSEDSIKLRQSILNNRVEILASVDTVPWILDSNWVFSAEDKPEFSGKFYDDRSWKKINSRLLQNDIDAVNFKGKGWFRIHLVLKDSFPVSIKLIQEGASEIWLDGKLMKSYGVIGTNEESTERYSPQFEPIDFYPDPGKVHVLAVRYANFEYDHSYDAQGNISAGFAIQIENAAEMSAGRYDSSISTAFIGIGFSVFYFTLGLVHFLMYIFYRKQRSNLFYSLFTFLLGYYFLHLFLSGYITSPELLDLLTLFVVFTIPLFFVSLLSVLYSFFYDKRPKVSWVFISLGLLCSVLIVFKMQTGTLLGILYLIGAIAEAMRIIIAAIIKKKRGCWVIGVGFGLFVMFILTILVVIILNEQLNLNDGSATGSALSLFLLVAIVSIPVSMSVYFAWDFARTNKVLQKKLEEIEELSEKNLQQEKEKQHILEKQKDLLEQQVTERTRELNEQKLELEEKNKSITDSINYASRIQRALIASEFYVERELRKLQGKK